MVLLHHRHSDASFLVLVVVHVVAAASGGSAALLPGDVPSDLAGRVGKPGSGALLVTNATGTG